MSLTYGTEARPGATIPDRFAAQARRTPNAVAVVAGDERVTYRELDARSNAVAERLQAIGVGAARCVVLGMDRGVEMIEGLLGISKAGATYVPADPDHPRPRLAALVEDSEAAAIITSERSRLVWPEGVPVLCGGGDTTAVGRGEASAPLGPRPESLAYVLFTSGSTGRPKGVMIEHGSVVSLADALFEAVYEGDGGPLRVSLNAPLFFDASVQQIVQLFFGHELWIVPEAVRRDGEALLAFLRDARIDVFDGTPAHLRMLAAAGLWSSEGHRPRRMLIGGEAIDPQTWTAARRNTRTRVYNVYGPTECTVDATSCDIQSGPDIPTIGRPLPGYHVTIVDPEMVPCREGEIGEICIGGRGLARGYLKNPELTATRFVRHPAVFGGGRFYKTGDCGRLLGDGNIEILGRTDCQVKIRGYRIELGDIESAVRHHPAVRDVAVVALDDGCGESRLVGYLVARNAHVTVSELRAFCREHLPEYMVPGVFMWLEALPLTQNGKVDRKALPAPHAERPPLDSEIVLPRTENPLAAKIYAIWRDVLRVPHVSPDDDFLALGGNSLSAVRVMIRTRMAAKNASLPLQLIFEHPRAGDFAAAVARFGT